MRVRERERETMEDYMKLEKVGEGTYGKVYRAKDLRNGRVVALKKTRLEMEEEGVPSTALREISLLHMLSESDYVVKLLSVEQVEENGKPVLYLVFEYLDTDLKKYMDLTGKGPNATPVPMDIVKRLMFHLVKGITHCHQHGVLHRDLKPQNLLVDRSKLELKIADLGLGRAFSIPLKSYTHEIVTLWYRAPEILLGSALYSTPVDMWSIGCIFAELVRKTPMFPGESEVQQLLHIFKVLGTPDESVWPGVSKLKDWHEFPQWKPQNLKTFFPTLEPEGLDLLQRCLVYDPKERISAKEAMAHPFFRDIVKQ